MTLQSTGSRPTLLSVYLSAVALGVVLLIGVAAGYIWAGHRSEDRLEACQRVITRGAAYPDPSFDATYLNSEQFMDRSACLDRDE